MNKQLTLPKRKYVVSLSLSVCPQAPKEYLYHHPDGELDRTDFKLLYRNLGLRFFVDKSKHQLMPTNTMRLRCLAQIDSYWPAHREVAKIVGIRKSLFDSLNQKLTNHRGAGSRATGTLSRPSHPLFSAPIVTVVLCVVFVHLPFVESVSLWRR